MQRLPVQAEVVDPDEFAWLEEVNGHPARDAHNSRVEARHDGKLVVERGEAYPHLPLHGVLEGEPAAVGEGGRSGISPLR